MPTAATSTGALLTAKVAELLGPEEPRGGRPPGRAAAGRVGQRPPTARGDIARRTSRGHPASRRERCPSASSRIASCVASARSSMPATVPPCITAIRSLMPRISGSSDEIIRIARPRAGELAHQPVDLGLGADVDALRRLVEDQHRRLRRQPAGQRHLLLVAAGEVADRRRRSTRVLIAEPLRRSRRRPRRSRPKSSSPQRRDRAEDRRASCWPRPTCRGSRRGGGGPRARRRCPARRPRAGESIAHRLARAAGSRPRRPASGRRGRAPARSGPRRRARPGRRSRRRGRSGRRRARPTPGSRAPRTSSTDVAERHGRAWGRPPTSSRPTIIRISSARSTSAIGRVPTSVAVAQDGHAVGDLRQLLEPVRDVDDPDALRPSARGSTRNRFSTSRSLSDAVGSSMIRIRASAPSALAISTSCCSGIVSARTSAVGVDRARRRAPSSSPRPARRRSPQRTRRHGPPRLEPERDVLGDGQVGEQRRLLVDRGDPERPGADRVVVVDRLALRPRASRRPAGGRR